MEMIVSPASDFEYSTASLQFPVVIEIRSEVSLEVWSPVDVSAALLTKIGEEEAEFGYVRRVSPISREVIFVSPEASLNLSLNLLEYDHDFLGFSPADYRCDVTVEVFLKKEAGFECLELRGGFLISIS